VQTDTTPETGFLASFSAFCGSGADYWRALIFSEKEKLTDCHGSGIFFFLKFALSHGVEWFLGSVVSRRGRLKPPTGPNRAGTKLVSVTTLELIIDYLLLNIDY